MKNGQTKLKLIVISAALATAVGGYAITDSGGTSPSSPLFPPVPAPTSIKSLHNKSLEALPARLGRLAPDMRPAANDVHALGYGGYAWLDGQSVCVFMPSGSGGCFETFTKPAVMFLSGETSSGEVTSELLEGVVPDTVRQLTIDLASGQSQQVTLVNNAFTIDLQPGDCVSGETVTLADGTSFFYRDPVSGPHGPHC
jgi:hypothetical protein